MAPLLAGLDEAPRLIDMSPQVTNLIERIKGLVVEARRPGLPTRQREAIGEEIARLQERLADVVKRELAGHAPG